MKLATVHKCILSLVICFQSALVQHQSEHEGVSTHPIDTEDALSLLINDKVTACKVHSLTTAAKLSFLSLGLYVAVLIGR